VIFFVFFLSEGCLAGISLIMYDGQLLEIAGNAQMRCVTISLRFDSRSKTTISSAYADRTRVCFRVGAVFACSWTLTRSHLRSMLFLREERLEAEELLLLYLAVILSSITGCCPRSCSFLFPLTGNSCLWCRPRLSHKFHSVPSNIFPVPSKRSTLC
jgi:hypothetical protein